MDLSCSEGWFWWENWNLQRQNSENGYAPWSITWKHGRGRYKGWALQDTDIRGRAKRHFSPWFTKTCISSSQSNGAGKVLVRWYLNCNAYSITDNRSNLLFFLWLQARFAHLCTVMSQMHHRRGGYPFGSLVDFAPDAMGRKLLNSIDLILHIQLFHPIWFFFKHLSELENL